MPQSPFNSHANVFSGIAGTTASAEKWLGGKAGLLSAEPATNHGENRKFEEPTGPKLSSTAKFADLEEKLDYLCTNYTLKCKQDPPLP